MSQRCPKCHSTKLIKRGFTEGKTRKQRFFCKNCNSFSNERGVTD